MVPLFPEIGKVPPSADLQISDSPFCSFLPCCFLFTSKAIAEDSFRKNRIPHRVFRLVCCRVRKRKLKAIRMVCILHYRVITKHAFKWPHAKLRQHSKFFAMPTANRNTEVYCGVSRGYQQKQILRVTI